MSTSKDGFYDRSVVDVFEQTCATYASNPAFSCMGRTLSFADIDRLSAKFAAYLQSQTTLQPGDRIAMQMPNILQYPVALFGALRAGLVVVNTNPLYTPREIKHQLRDSGAKALVVLANVAEAASSIVDETDVEQVIVTELADLHTPLKRLLINYVVDHVKKLVPHVSFKQRVSFLDCLQASSSDFVPVQREPDDIAVLQYTGGTTGVAKGAMLTHRNLVANMVQVKAQLNDAFRGAEDYFVAPLPLYHIYAFTIHCMCTFSQGSHTLLIPNPRDIKGFVDALKGQPFTGFMGLNTLFNALCHNEEFQQLDFSHLRLTCSGGMALTKDASDLWEKVTGCHVCEGYGLTETSPVVCINPYTAIQDGSVGTPVPDTEVKLMDVYGDPVPEGEVGELCIRGPQVMKGYWQREDDTREVIDQQGWFRSGDLARIQSDGYVCIVDRIKDLIIVSGFNVYPNEVEDVVCSHPGVLEAAVIGVADVLSGEAVKLFVVKADENLTEQQVLEQCRESLTAYKIPHSIEFRDELPKTNVGKVLRRELR